jgi:C4-dicarboxylate transporter, DctM subunit
LQGMTKREITYIARVTLPYFFLMALAILLLWWFPQIALYLPGQMSKAVG